MNIKKGQAVFENLSDEILAEKIIRHTESNNKKHSDSISNKVPTSAPKRKKGITATYVFIALSALCAVVFTAILIQLRRKNH